MMASTVGGSQASLLLWTVVRLRFDDPALTPEAETGEAERARWILAKETKPYISCENWENTVVIIGMDSLLCGISCPFQEQAVQDFAKCALSQGITKIRSSGAGIYKQIDKVENHTLAALGARRSGELKAVSEWLMNKARQGSDSQLEFMGWKLLVKTLLLPPGVGAFQKSAGAARKGYPTWGTLLSSG